MGEKRLLNERERERELKRIFLFARGRVRVKCCFLNTLLHQLKKVYIY